MPALVMIPESSAEAVAGGDRMGRRQPGVQRPHAALGAEAEGGQDPCHVELSAVFIRRGQLTQAGDLHRAEHILQQEEAHQRDQTADHGEGQIAVRGAHGAGGLLMGHQRPGRYAHHLKADQQRIQVRRQEHAQGGPLGDQIVEIIAALMLGVGEILLAEHRAAKPEHRAHQAEDPTQPVQGKAESQTAEPGKSKADLPGKAEAQQQKNQQQLQRGRQPAGHSPHPQQPRAVPLLPLRAGKPADQTPKHRQQHQDREQRGGKSICHVFPPPFTSVLRRKRSGPIAAAA